MTVTPSFLVSRLLNEKSEKGPSNETLLHYKEIVDSQKDVASSNHASYLTASKLIEIGKLTEAFQMAIEMICRLPDDPQTRNDFYFLIGGVHEELKRLGVKEPSNPEIAKSYNSLLELGVLDMEVHYIVLQHYLVVGDFKTAQLLLKTIKATLPNYTGLKEIEEQLSNLTKESK